MRTATLALMAFVSLFMVGLIAAGQEKAEPKQPDEKGEKDKQPSDPGAGSLLKAFDLTQKSPSSVKEFSEIIELCEKGVGATSDKAYAAYGKKLCAWAHFKRGELHAAAGKEADDKQALADFDSAVKLQDQAAPDNPEWNYIHQRGVSYAMAGQYEQALADFNRVLELRPNFGKEYFNRGEIYSAQGKFDKAIEDYNFASRYGYNESTLYARRGFAFFKLKNVRQAMSDYNRAIAQNSQDYEAFTYRGDAYAAPGDSANSGNFAAAVRDYQRAITLNNRYGRAFFSSAWLRATCPDANYRDASIALRNAQEAIKLDGERYNYLDALAAAQARAGQFDEAVATVKKAIDAAPKEEREALQQRLELYENKTPYESVEGGGAKKTPEKKSAPAVDKKA